MFFIVNYDAFHRVQVFVACLIPVTDSDTPKLCLFFIKYQKLNTINFPSGEMQEIIETGITVAEFNCLSLFDFCQFQYFPTLNNHFHEKNVPFTCHAAFIFTDFTERFLPMEHQSCCEQHDLRTFGRRGHSQDRHLPQRGYLYRVFFQ
jgi:hypothetical protein